MRISVIIFSCFRVMGMVEFGISIGYGGGRLGYLFSFE